ncbi:hypothetical protein [Arenibaculum pallidiluteum]|uniref:hypothetical protein n=1 Tax=Arenibaculum pallidiluteum TaxID=2812559 RepID=UPI001A96EB12|nr:hypothetical protein [Arenibaculum pallidiluteum]
MALRKSVPTEFGIDATYHRIAGMQAYYADRCADVVLHGYVSDGARHGGSRAVAAATLRVSAAQMGYGPEDGIEPTRAQLYAAVKASEGWADAADC